MNPTVGIFLALGIVVMIALVIFLSRVNNRKVARDEAVHASTLGLKASDESSRLALLPLLWRTSDQSRHTRGLLEGKHAGWDVRAFLFEHDPDSTVLGVRAITRLFARSLMAVSSLITDSRTATQRAILVAVAYEGDPAKFTVSRRKLRARDTSAKQLLPSRGSHQIQHWTPPARIQLQDGWLLLQSFYILPKWLAPYVMASTDICDVLAKAGAIQPRLDGT